MCVRNFLAVPERGHEIGQMAPDRPSSAPVQHLLMPFKPLQTPFGMASIEGPTPAIQRQAAIRPKQTDRESTRRLRLAEAETTTPANNSTA